MRDRVSLFPGRVKLTPVAGQANTYDMARADQPTQEGTPINKESLLKDSTAAMFGLGANAVPDEIFSKIKNLVDIATNSANSKAKIETGSYVGTGQTGASNPCTLTLGIVPKIVIIYELFRGDRTYRAAWFANLKSEYNDTSVFQNKYICGYYDLFSYDDNYLTESGRNFSKFSGNQLSWYGMTPMNTSGTTYEYIAIG